MRELLQPVDRGVHHQFELPIDDTAAAREGSLNPPHIQARGVAGSTSADRWHWFLVTMEEPSRSQPEPIVFNIGAERDHP